MIEKEEGGRSRKRYSLFLQTVENWGVLCREKLYMGYACAALESYMGHGGVRGVLRDVAALRWTLIQW